MKTKTSVVKFWKQRFLDLIFIDYFVFKAKRKRSEKRKKIEQWYELFFKSYRICGYFLKKIVLVLFCT